MNFYPMASLSGRGADRLELRGAGELAARQQPRQLYEVAGDGGAHRQDPLRFPRPTNRL